MFVPRRASRSLLAGALLLALGTMASPSRATVVERVVAVVGERAILLSDLRKRAAPYLAEVYAKIPPGAQQSAQISQMYKALVEKMVDEELEQRAAIQAKVVVSEREVDEALGRLAAQNNVTVQQLLMAAQSSGLDLQQYRDELRRQLLQYKLINVRMQGRIRVTEDDLKSEYRKLVLQERQTLTFRVGWIYIAARGDGRTQRALAERVASAARTTSFAELAGRYSEDAATRGAGGELPATRFEQLPPALRRAVLGLELGEPSGVIPVSGGFAILKLLDRQQSQLPQYVDARRELSERVSLEKMNQAHRTWLDNLRRQQHVEVRL